MVSFGLFGTGGHVPNSFLLLVVRHLLLVALVQKESTLEPTYLYVMLETY